MTQTTFGSNATPSLPLLDQNFTQLYDLRELVSTPSYAAATPFVTMGIGPSSGSVTPYLVSRTTTGPAAIGASHADGTYNVRCALFADSTVGAQKFGVDCSYSSVILGFAVRFNGVERLVIDGSGNGATGTDNTQTWGTAAKRWSTFYAGTGAINTSDAREKTAVRSLADAELAAAKALAREVGSFQWLAAVAEKGAAARLHIGLTVQRAMQVMSEHGLDPLRYAFVCHDAWPADGDAPAGERYSLRTDQLLLFISRGFDARLAALEARA